MTTATMTSSQPPPPTIGTTPAAVTASLVPSSKNRSRNERKRRAAAAIAVVNKQVNRSIDTGKSQPGTASSNQKRTGNGQSKLVRGGTTVNTTAKEQQEDKEDQLQQQKSELRSEVEEMLQNTGVGAEMGLSRQIRRLYHEQRASEGALVARMIMIEKLEWVLNNERWDFGHPHNPKRNPLIVEPFGSVRFGLATSTSDLDLCIFDPYRPEGLELSIMSKVKDPNAPTLPEIYNMKDLGRRLKRAGLERINAVAHASVPIVKFETTIDHAGRKYRIQADINTNERFGVFNSRLLAAYCDLHDDVRPLCVFIKYWAKQRLLNDPSGASGTVSLSSYTLILLVISYLQHRRVLPNLQSAELIEQAGIKREKFWTKPRKLLGRRSRFAGKTPTVSWDVTFVTTMPEEAKWVPESIPLQELAEGFFDYYANRFSAETKIVSVQAGVAFERQRPFGDFMVQQEQERVEKVEEEGEDGRIQRVDAMRQAEEDAAIAAMAEEDGLTPFEVIAAEKELEATTSVIVGEFIEPTTWSQKLIVQDPFLLTRNTALNIVPHVVDHIFSEMRRALAIMQVPGSTLESVCFPTMKEEGYQDLKRALKAPRQRRRKEAGTAAPTLTTTGERVEEELLRKNDAVTEAMRNENDLHEIQSAVDGFDRLEV